ncbi:MULTISPECIES: PP2C family serine/threonine-protein phosphatase [unclassified Mycoplasma]|uniref:PP2C family protein-serine/threonine phosphatase n=1 Tax=unclassified Mycoplasma TaxID=2683645 RepID=UPI00211CECE7|nr:MULTISPECIES: PP2C family serine/threonine-protein phosphatase [unclassified Mycoplasma]UUM19697.1 protein phosphatase 2C domain-containing protein [Mycoplasma sp. 1578d]UUM24680.1 protein phosphatase 2C domain-containing protein [Mycoplasma sp. 3686d]
MKVASKSIKGNYRSKNDDRVGVFQNEWATLAILCDGIGGYSGGDIAANIVVSEFGISFQKNFKFTEFAQIEHWVDQTVLECRKLIKKAAQQNKITQNMGTTLTGAIILPQQEKILLFNSGDSRVYIVTHTKNLIQATKDNNVENKLIQEGYKVELAKANPLASYLTSAVGLNIKTTIHFEEIESDIYRKIDKLLITSDGVHSFLYKIEMEQILNTQLEPKEQINQLIERATIAESTDNMSGIIIHLERLNAE